MKISIIGLGWFGEALAQELKTDHKVMGTTRSDEKIQTLMKQNIIAEKLTISETPSKKMLSADVIVLNIPPFQNQLAWFKSWKWNESTHVIFISSTSVYGKNTGTVDETTYPLPETENAKILFDEEKWIQHFPKYTIIRFAGLIGPNRHPSKSLSGKKNVPGGNLPVNLIHLDDCISFTKMVIEKKLINETFNLVSPEHPLRRDYYLTADFIDSQEEGKIVSHLKVSKFYQIKKSLN